MTWRRVCLLMAGLTLLVYASSFFNAFVWDDEQFIYENTHVLTFNLPAILTSNTIAGAGEVSNYYRPLTTLSFAIDHALWGLRPFGFHLTNTVLHISAGLVLVGIFYELTYQLHHLKPTPQNQPLIWLVPLFFLLHPVQTEAVTYMNSRGDSLFAAGVFTSIWILLLSQRTHVRLNLYDQTLTISKLHLRGLSLLLLGLSFFAKETAIAGAGLFLVVAGITQIHEIRKIVWRLWLPALIACGLSLGYLGLRATALNFQNSFNFYGQDTPYTQQLTIRLGTFAQAYWTYWQVLLRPWPLHMERSVPIASGLINPWMVALLASQLLWVGLGWFEWRRRHTTWVWFGWGWWWVWILPISGVIPINGLLYEHWLYVPMVGFFVSWLSLFIGYGQPLIRRWPHLLTVALVGGISLLSLYAGLTIRQNYIWGDPIRFYEYTLKFNQTARLWNNLGMAYADAGRYQMAIDAYHQALALDVYPQIYHNLGNTYLDMRRYADAEHAFEQALTVNPQFYFSYANLIKIYLDQNRVTEAWPLLDTLHRLQPQNHDVTQVWKLVKTAIEASAAAKKSPSL